MKTHEVRSWTDFFSSLASGDRQFDLRKNDRDYKVGDIIKFREYDDRAGKFTGAELRRRITHVMEGVGAGSITPLHGLQRGYVILSLGSPA